MKRGRKRQRRSSRARKHRSGDARPEPAASSQALRALTTGALTLGGIAGSAAADTPIDHVYTDYNYSTYREDDLDDSKGLPLATRERYEVDMHQFILQAPVPWTERWDFSLELVQESMSGASPEYVVPDAAGSPIQVMSGATISDERNDVLLNTNHYYDNARAGMGFSYSTENDYNSYNFALDGETHFNEKSTTLAGGLAVSFDTIEPTDAATNPNRPSDEDKRTYSLFSGLSQIIDRSSIAKTSLTYRMGDGYLSDPYKQVFVVTGGLFLPDSRPDSRHQLSWLTQYRRHIEEVNGTLHLDYQFYIDSWDITSHTLELAWYQTWRDHLHLVPSIRYYSQSEAGFYTPYFNTAPAAGDDFSTDFRLSAYGAVSFGLKAEYVFRIPWTGDIDWKANAGWERYVSSADLSHSNPAIENPGLVSFTVLTVGFGARF